MDLESHISNKLSLEVSQAVKSQTRISIETYTNTVTNGFHVNFFLQVPRKYFFKSSSPPVTVNQGKQQQSYKLLN